MCGIAGLVALDTSLERVRENVAGMTARIAHRGPDGGGIAVHPDATLGMKRLAIVDVEHGHQPLANEDDSVVIVFNGEIYNAPALRTRLEREGVRFRTRSDTEVILRLYEQNPERVEEQLAGMWAWAIHDRRRRRVVLSRDRFGIKPLFIADTGSALAFASELWCFDRSTPGFGRLFAIDHAAAHAMVSWSFVPETATIFEGVRRLAPASRLEIDLSTGARRTRSYWQLTPNAAARRITTLEDAMTEVETLLRRSVREHLESDVPVASFLSGGIDSSLVTALLAEESPRPIKAFSIGFREPAFDESPWARKTAAVLGVDLDVTMLDEPSIRQRVPDALLAYDEPFGDSSSLATYLLCGRVARDYKVALGGDGGDEVFAGYKKHLALRLRAPFARAPGLRDALGRALRTLPTRTDRTRPWTEVLRTARRLSTSLDGTDEDVYAALTQVAPLARTATLMRAPARAEEFVDAARHRFASTPGNSLDRTLTSDLVNPLANDMLVKVDRASMAHHLEARVPFLDHRVVEFGVGLPQRFTLGTKGKRVLRALHEKRFGPALANRKKQGFRVPVEAWLRGPLDRVCERLFDKARLDRYGVLSSEALSGGGFRELVRTDPVIVWHVVCLAAWCEANLGGGRDEARELLTSDA